MPRILFPSAALILMTVTAHAWVAELKYPLEVSSLWETPKYAGPAEEIQALTKARGLVPRDPRYEFRMSRLYQKALFEGRLDDEARRQVLAQAASDFNRAVKARPVYSEYLASFALLSIMSHGDSQPQAEEKINQALLLGYQDLSLRALAATYYQYLGMRERALELWRSIMVQSPGKASEILERSSQFYRDPSFLSELAPVENAEALVRFQEALIGFQKEDWGKNVFLKTLPLLIQKTRENGGSPLLFEVIGRTYRAAGDTQNALFWYERAFQSGGAPESRAALLMEIVDILFHEGRFMEARRLLEQNLDLVEVRPRLRSLYDEASQRMGPTGGTAN